MMANLAGSILTLLLLLFVGASIPFPSASAQSLQNQLVKAGTPAVYYVGEDSKRYVFPNERIFFSWYRDFSSVQTISDAQLASLPIGGNIFYRPGTRLVKITTDPKVYAVGLGGALYDIASEEAALRLYGTSWAQRVDDLPDAFFSSYKQIGSLNGSSHPAGTLIRYKENSAYYVLGYVDSVLFARQITIDLIGTFGLSRDEAISVFSTDFPYPVGANWSADEASLFRPNQPAAIIPETEETPGGETGDTPTPATSAAVSVTKHASMPPSIKAVIRDPASRILAITLKGDPKQPVTISRLRFRVFIDAGGPDNDFVQGSDSDSTIFWAVNQLLAGFTVRDFETHKALSQSQQADSEGVLEFPVSISLAAGETKSVELTAEVRTVQPSVRIGADLIPAQDITAAAGDASLSITPDAYISGGTSPGTVVTTVNNGTLVIGSKNEGGDRFEKIGNTIDAYTLTLTANGEPFRVSALALGFIAGGADIYAINRVTATFPMEDGAIDSENEHEVDENALLYRYINLPIYVPKDTTVNVTFDADTKDDPFTVSNARLQFKFNSGHFAAQGVYSNVGMTSDHFADKNKLDDKTTNGSLLVLRQGFISFSSHPDTPKTSVTRYNKIPVLTFSVSAKEHEVTIRQLSFRVDSSDVDVDGEDNDFFERVADTFANTVIGISTHHPDISERTSVPTQSVTFKLYDASTGGFSSAPGSVVTDTGDYGFFTVNFGSSPITIPAGTTRSYDVDINTTLVSADDEANIKIRMLGDGKSTPASQANLLWNDGSNVLGTGYLVPGLDLQGFTLSVQ